MDFPPPFCQLALKIMGFGLVVADSKSLLGSWDCEQPSLFVAHSLMGEEECLRAGSRPGSSSHLLCDPI